MWRTNSTHPALPVRVVCCKRRSTECQNWIFVSIYSLLFLFLLIISLVNLSLSVAVQPDSNLPATCETFSVGLGFKLLNLPCSGRFPFSIKRCSTTRDASALKSELKRLQNAIQITDSSVCVDKFKQMCSRLTSKLDRFQPLILVDSESSNATRSQANGVYVLRDVLSLCCNPLNDCQDDDSCLSHTRFNVQECCSNCESTYQKCYEGINSGSGTANSNMQCALFFPIWYPDISDILAQKLTWVYPPSKRACTS